MFYLDTSALVKRYRREKGSEVLDFLFEHKGADDRLVVSFLSTIELAGVTTRLRKSRALSESRVSELMSRFKEDLLHAVEVFPVSEPILGQAIGIAERHGIRAADSIHVATIIELHQAAAIAGIRFLALAADKAMGECIEEEGIALSNPEDEDALGQLRSAMEQQQGQ
ncbi:MAG: type II toxin-antitoxin system VapC family toxin [Chloroflexi bacterium]|nr:type II toxin-antitoxin system VapC family toxin [Chloroflexota bacterium]